MKKLAVPFLLLLAALAGCGSGDTPADAPETSAAVADSTGAEDAPKQEKAIKVNVSSVRQGDLVRSVYADGVLRTPRTVQVTSKLAGQVRERHKIVLEFLRSLGVPAKDAELDAEGIEHHISPATLAAMQRHLRQRSQ